jgi:hypothetical protein
LITAYFFIIFGIRSKPNHEHPITLTAKRMREIHELQDVGEIVIWKNRLLFSKSDQTSSLLNYGF